MKRNKKVLFFMFLILMITLIFGCNDEESSVPKEIIEKFLNEKSNLYKKQDEIMEIITISLEYDENDTLDVESKEERFDENLKDVKVLLNQEEYDRLLISGYLIDENFLKRSYEEGYDKSEIKDIEFEKLPEEEGKIVYSVEYTEILYFENEVKKEMKNVDKFTLEKIDSNWLIIHIE